MEIIGESIGLMSAINELNVKISSLLQYLQGDFFKYFFAYSFACVVFGVFLSFAMYKMFDIIARRK